MTASDGSEAGQQPAREQPISGEPLDVQAVARFVGPLAPDILPDRVWSATLLAGGRSNLTYRLTGSSNELVLRRPPLGKLLPSAHDMRREFIVQKALSAVGYPVPRPLVYCGDTSVIGCEFYIMEFIAGVGLQLPCDLDDLSRTARTDLSTDLMTTLADLHAIPPASIGLGEWGNAEDFVPRQVRRWTQQWERSRTRDLPGMDELAQMLTAGVADLTVSSGTVVHGDFRLENMILTEGQSPRIRAVLDWELATVGEPMADLGFTLSYWRSAGGPVLSEAPDVVLSDGGFPTVDEMSEIYGRRSGRDVSQLDFYRVLALFKVAAIFEGIHARYLASDTIGEGFDQFGERVPMLVDQALELASTSTFHNLKG